MLESFTNISILCDVPSGLNDSLDLLGHRVGEFVEVVRGLLQLLPGDFDVLDELVHVPGGRHPPDYVLESHPKVLRNACYKFFFSNTPFRFWVFVSVRAVIYDIGNHISKTITNLVKFREPALVL